MSLTPRLSAGWPADSPDAGEDGPVRVMVVDDSAVVRRVVKSVLSEVAGLEIVGVATNGQEGVDLVEQCHPHVVVMDVEMPVMDGLAALRAIRPKWPALPVIMFSTLTSRGAAATIDALSIGASDYATKPVSMSDLDETVAAMRRDLVPRVESWGRIGRRRQPTERHRAPRSTVAPLPTTPRVPIAGRTAVPSLRPAPAPRVSAASFLEPRPVVAGRTAGPVEAIAIGCSAGGPNALADLVPRFPADLPVPIVLTQHMPETFTALLASRLDEQSAITVLEADRGMVLQPGHLYIAKGGWHMVLAKVGGRVVIDLDEGPPENYCRPAVDVMFRSAARIWGPALQGAVLTGMGRDGVAGARQIFEAGGSVITQDEESCLVWGMPGAVVAAGLSEAEYPLSEIADELCRRVARRSRR